ncbi:DUF559 domain-containing protein [Siccirubricoccus phaeus]|uniref:DUF559 domain-containing protein n=1 Tax=Siccirubricoccus phaeus TaxID=2595053 RepID=UPI002E26A26D
MQPKDSALQRHARAMRREATPPERLLWRMLRNATLGVRFRRPTSHSALRRGFRLCFGEACRRDRRLDACRSGCGC